MASAMSIRCGHGVGGADGGHRAVGGRWAEPLVGCEAQEHSAHPQQLLVNVLRPLVRVVDEEAGTIVVILKELRSRRLAPVTPLRTEHRPHRP